MIRVVSSVVGTIVALVLLLSFKSQSPLTTSAAGLPQASIHSAVAAPSPVASPVASGAPPDPAGASGATSSAAAAPTTAAPTTAAPTAAPPMAKSYDGRAITTRYGVVQVQVDVTGSTITNVAFLQLTAFDRRSQQINADAATQLLEETLNAQSANIDAVSGASYTSAGYRTSLQSALDSAGLK